MNNKLLFRVTFISLVCKKKKRQKMNLGTIVLPLESIVNLYCIEKGSDDDVLCDS